MAGDTVRRAVATRSEGVYALMIKSCTARFVAKRESDTDRLGSLLAECLPDRTIVGLLGTLGAGKTRLVRAIAEACGVDPRDVTSPTFVLCQSYHGTRSLIHLDAYRLVDLDEFLELGPEEFYETASLTLIEWSDRVDECLPAERIEISIEIEGEEGRIFEVVGRGERLSRVVREISKVSL